ncbi:MAG: carboxypeptidase regulatory-like domain-containing protein [Candidatus Acidiferrales bacterium]
MLSWATESSVFARHGRAGRAWRGRALPVCLLCAAIALLRVPAASAQISGAISGTVTDESGAVVVGANVTARNVDTSAERSATSDAEGHYEFSAIPLGPYEVRATHTGFSETIHKGIQVVVSEDAEVDLTLKIGSVGQQITVEGDAPLVSVTTQDISGLVGQQQVKDLPLNGRSYDLLLPLNPGIVNFTSQKAGGTGVSNSTNGNNFAVSGNRPQQNIFLLNGVEYTGAAENNMTPGGASGELLGVEAVREFNVLRDSYGAEYGKKPGGQVVVVTQSGSNQLHGSLYEYVRNNALDAPNYFDADGPPPFQRNQFGVAVGGPIQKDKTFFFANYEGLRLDLNQTSKAFVPSLASRAAAAPSVVPLLSLWPTPPAGAPDYNGISPVFSSPLQTIREDFGTARVDHIFSERDTLSGVYTVDDGSSFTATTADPYSADLLNLREQVFSLEETHIFSPTLLNTARVGYSRAGYFFAGEPTPGTPAAGVPGFLDGDPVGAVVVGGSAASNPQAQVGLAGSNNGSDLRVARNIYTYEDRVTLTRGRQQFSFGAWFQQFQSNETLALSQFGQATFASLTTFLAGTTSSFLYDPAPTELNWRSLFTAVYGQDVIRVTPKLTVSLGFRGEISNGWNEAHGRAANYTFTDGVISTDPQVGSSVFTTNNAKFLPQPRIGVAWSPFGQKTVIRAGFGMYNDLQDALGYRTDQNAPFNPTYSIAALPVTSLPIDPAAPVPAGAKLVPGGVQPDMDTPTLISYTLRVQQQISPNTAVTIGYVGSHGYHEVLGEDANEPIPTVCPSAACPSVYPTYDASQPTSPTNSPALGFPINQPSGAPNSPLAGAPVPTGSYYIPVGTPKANPSPLLANTWTWFAEGNSSYNALQVDVNRRFSRGFSVRGVYTWSKALDDGDSLNQTTANNAPGLVSNPYDLRADWGPATYNVRNLGVINAIYDLPIGQGRTYLSDVSGATAKLVSGWGVTSIITLQSGFPFTPQLSYNPSNNGDTRNPVRAFLNPDFTGPVILGTPTQWFNPSAFIAPPTTLGFYGNVGRDAYTGPGLATWDFSVLKNTSITERFNLQFRAEIFNLLNRANFNTPNLIVFTPAGVSGTAGAISSTSTTSRQVQFALKLLF